MAEDRQRAQTFPDLPAKSYFDLRKRFQAAPPSQVTPSYLASVLNVSLKTGQNILPQVWALGLIDDQGRLTDLAHDWRIDDHFGEAVATIRERTHPQELRDALPCPSPDTDGVARWMARRLNVGTSRATNMARIYVLLCQSDPNGSESSIGRTRTSQSTDRVGQRTQKQQTPGSASAEQFPLPRSGLKVLRLILLGYLNRGGRDRRPVGPSSIGAAVGMDQTLVSRNNAFLAAIGLIEAEGRGQWRLTEVGASVAQAFEYDATEELASALASTLRSNEFVQRILTLVRSRGGVEELQLIRDIARLAGAPAKSEFLTGSRTLLDLLLAAGLVVIEGGVYRTSSRRDSQGSQATQSAVDEESSGEGRSSNETSRPRAQFTVSVNLTAADLETDDQIRALAARLRQLADALEHKSPDDAS